MYTVKLQGERKRIFEVEEVNGNMLSIWRLRLLHADPNVLRRITQVHAVRGMDKSTPVTTNKWSPCANGKMKNTSIQSRTNLKRKPGAIADKDIAETNVTLIGGKR